MSTLLPVCGFVGQDSDDGSTPLFLAIQYRLERVAATLIAHGANVVQSRKVRQCRVVNVWWLFVTWSESVVPRRIPGVPDRRVDATVLGY